MFKTPHEGLNSENHTTLQSSCLIKSPFNFLTAKVERHWASSVTDTTTNEDRQYVTSSAALKSVPVGPHMGITEVPSAYHVPLFPGTPLPCCVFIHLSFKVVPRVTTLSARPARTVNIKRHGTVSTKRWVQVKLLWRHTWQYGWRSPGLLWHSPTGMDFTSLRLKKIASSLTEFKQQTHLFGILEMIAISISHPKTIFNNQSPLKNPSATLYNSCVVTLFNAMISIY